MRTSDTPAVEGARIRPLRRLATASLVPATGALWGAYVDSISPRGRDLRVTTSAWAFATFKAWGADPYLRH